MAVTYCKLWGLSFNEAYSKRKAILKSIPWEMYNSWSELGMLGDLHCYCQHLSCTGLQTETLLWLTYIFHILSKLVIKDNRSVGYIIMMNSILQVYYNHSIGVIHNHVNWRPLIIFHSCSKLLHNIIKNKLGIVAQACNPQIWEADAGGLQWRLMIV